MWLALAPLACSATPVAQTVREDLGLGCDVMVAMDPAVLARVSGLPAVRIEQAQDVCRTALAVDAALRVGAAGVAGAAGAP
jgi:hypothetical protein